MGGLKTVNVSRDSETFLCGWMKKSQCVRGFRYSPSVCGFKNSPSVCVESETVLVCVWIKKQPLYVLS